MYLNRLVFVFLVILLISISYKQTQGTTDNGAIKREADRFYGSLVFDKNGVPHYNYSYTGHNSIGLQGSPHAVSQHALKLYNEFTETANESAKTLFFNNVDWLVNTEMLKHNGSFSVYEYSFPWKIGNNTVEAPWRNAMVGGEALSPLVKAFQLSGNKTYLDTAKKILNSFYIDVKDGGVTYKTPNSGWWYEEYASNNSTKEYRVLNGMIHALLGINEYFKMTSDSSAKFLFDQGILALKNDLPKYDNNGTSYYDRLGWPANSFYESLHAIQLKQLYDMTHELIFKTFYDRWNKYNIENSQ